MDRRGSEPFAESSLTLENTEYSSSLLSKLNELRQENALTDVVLIAGNESFPCHKNVLAVSSPYFKAMFSGDLRESTQKEINMQEISPWTLGRIIDYAYSGNLEITVENAQDMLAAGSLFQYQEIIDACCNFLCKHLHPSNCLGIENFAHLHSCSKLESQAHQYVLDNFSSVIDHDEYLEIPIERLLTYLASDLIDVPSEECVYNASMRWVHHSIENRRSKVSQIMSLIRLNTLDIQYVRDFVQVDPVIVQCETSLKMVQNAVNFNESDLSQQQLSFQSDSTIPRPSTIAREVLVVLGGFTDANTTTNSVEMYDPSKNKWYPLPDMPSNVGWFDAVSFDNDIYVTGGILDSHIISDVWKFESSKRNWKQLCSMLEPRARHASAEYKGRIYVLGGINLKEDNKIGGVEGIECFNPDINQWTKVGECPFPKKQSHLVPFKQTLVEVGGSRGDYPEDTMETFLLNGEYVVHSGEQFRLPKPIQFAQIVILNGVFYIIWEKEMKVIMLDPQKRTFRDLSTLRQTHIHSGSSVLNGKIYVAGGLKDSKPSTTVECYDTENNVWGFTKEMSQSKACHGCVTIFMR